jgi:hypothetical protein
MEPESSLFIRTHRLSLSWATRVLSTIFHLILLRYILILYSHLHHRVQTGSGAHPASYPMGNGGFFPGGKVAETLSWPLIFIYFVGQRRCGAIHLLPQYVFIAWCLVKHSDKLYLLSTPRSFEWTLPLRFSDQNFVGISRLSPCMLHVSPISSSLTWSPNNIWNAYK